MDPSDVAPITHATDRLPPDVLHDIFGLLSSHERRVIVPLVCKVWAGAVAPRPSTSKLWTSIQIRDDARVSVAPCNCKTAALERHLRRWLLERRNYVEEMDIDVSNGHEDGQALASWATALGLALPVLAAASDSAGTGGRLLTVTLNGPGVYAAGKGASAPDAAGAVLLGAFSLPSLETLTVCDIPWVASLLHLSSIPGAGPGLANLRRLTLTRCFYHATAPRSSYYSASASPTSASGGGTNPSDEADIVGGNGGYLLDAGTAEAWEVLGRCLAALPHLEYLDLGHTHAMTYVDPARGATSAAWPALPALRELSLAHDLSVQPPPPPRPLLVPSAAAPAQSAAVAAAEGEEEEEGGMRAEAGGAFAAEVELEAELEAADSWFQLNDHQHQHQHQHQHHLNLLEQEHEQELYAQQLLPADQGPCEQQQQQYDSELLTVDAAHACVELLTWLPRCGGLTRLDLRFCGLEAVPLAVVHLRCLEKLDLQGNPLVSLRLPGPLACLTWLRFSLDPCYDMLYDMMVAEAGEVAAVDEMMTAELPTPLLEELEVDGGSYRALQLVREAAGELPCLRRLAVTDSTSGL